MRNWRVLTVLIGLIFSSAGGQDLRLYFSLLQEGRTSEVRASIPDLQRQYPNNAGVAYLNALITTDGDSSLQLYQDIIRKHPKSNYAAGAAMKVGEYLYSRGLYTQASRQCRQIPQRYPQAASTQRAIDLMVNSYQATGELDSAAHYLARFKRKFPDLNFNYGIPGLDDIDVPPADVELVKLDQQQARQKLKQTKKPKPIPAPPVKKDLPRPWVIQVGAFGNYDNATSLRSKLVQNGFEVDIEQVSSNNRRLHVVRVVRYPSRTEATKIGNELKRRYGLNFLVMNRPE